MQAWRLFNQYFSFDTLSLIYTTYLQYKRTVGIDKMSTEVFEVKINKHINTILKKVSTNSYEYSFYKAKLILKGRDKLPRVISIPTIRDRLTLKTLSLLLFELYKSEIKFKLVQTIISDIKEKLDNYNSFIKIDIADFYPSINHNILRSKLYKKIRKPEILSLIFNALKTKSLISSDENVGEIEKGIPQGLAISNILANIYMLDMDKTLFRKRKFKYYRYVDDILILCNSEDILEIKSFMNNQLAKLKLDTNEEKYKDGDLTKEFSYLGYLYTAQGFTVRKQSIIKFQESILRNITIYKHSDTLPLNYLIWIINLRVTGCIIENNKYGWMFFYSQIDKLRLLYEIDHFIKKMLNKNLEEDEKFKSKKLVRTYFEITKNLTRTNYIPNFSEYDLIDKQKLLNEVFGFKDPFGWPQLKVEIIFRKKIFQSIRDLERDFQTFS